MSADIFLDKHALQKLTGGRARRTEQCKVLEALGIPFKIVGREVLVMTSHAQAWMENRPVRQIIKPRLDLVR